MITTDYLIVGSGLTGGVLARLLTDAGRNVIVLDRRKHIGGNVYDEKHTSGIRFHTYGPHFFRTNSTGIWSFVQKYASFYDYFHEVSTYIDGQTEAWPVTKSYIQKLLGNNWEPEFKGEPANFEEASQALMPKVIYDKFVKGYNQKQWGIDPKLLESRLARRFDVRNDNERKLFRHRYQGLPYNGYAGLMNNLLAGIDVRTDSDYLQEKERYQVRKKLIFTGPIDEFFAYKYGKLHYRGQKRELTYHPQLQQLQPGCQVNYPSLEDGPFVRKLEWKHLMPEQEKNNCHGTLITTEIPHTPSNPDNFEYPFPDRKNSELYSKYRELAQSQENVLICGRLGEYRYYDMDQAIGRALMLAHREFGLKSEYHDEESQKALNATT